jgi:hypothetical protein
MLVGQNAAAPAMTDGVLHIIEGFIEFLALGDNNQMCPQGIWIICERGG